MPDKLLEIANQTGSLETLLILFETPAPSELAL